MMGETTALKQRLDYLPRDHALATAAVYHSLFREGKGDDAGVPATFQVLLGRCSLGGPGGWQTGPDRWAST